MATIFVETQTFRAMLNQETGFVSIFQARQPEALIHKHWFLLGNGDFIDGMIRGSGINCGILVQLETLLHQKILGEPKIISKIPGAPILPIA